MNRVVMSIDAGGTKTKAALIDLDCNIVYEKVGGPGSPAVLQEEKAMKRPLSLSITLISCTTNTSSNVTEAIAFILF